ncbi:MAG: CHASE2 domain-containing protein [Pseudanabaenaceae cyanobacterium]
MSRFLGFGLTSLLAAIAGLGGAVNFPFLRAWELQLHSTFFAIRGAVKPPTEIVILAIDDTSLKQGEFYDPVKRPYLEPLRSIPWQRVVYAQVIEKLLQSGAKVVAVDVLFTTPSAYGIKDDQALQVVLTKYKERVVLAANLGTAASAEADIAQLESPGDVFDVHPHTPAYVNFWPDVDGTVRSLPPKLPAELPPLLSFAEATLKAGQVSYAQPQGEYIYFLGEGNTWLNYQQQIPFYYVIEPTNWENALQQGKFFENKIVLIGATAPSQQDIQPSAVGRMPGVEIHANAIATLMQNLSIREGIKANGWRGLFIFAVVVIAGSLLTLIRRPLWQLGATLLGVTLWGVIAYFLFIFAQVAIPTFLPIVGIASVGITLLAVGAIITQLEKLAFQRTLERYVALPIAQQILKQPEDYQAMMTGRTIKAAVLFSDIRGFTTISSYLPPQALVTQLNEYLGKMVDVILAENGTIDKFIGDAIMAEFGSPISQGAKTDALNAIRAALGMRTALIELRRKWEAEDKIPFVNGIGINYGEFTVGNIGSPRRLEYAVIGDTVNVASRVEGITKDLGTDIVITHALYELIKEEIEVIDYGERELKGRVDTVHLYGVVGWKGEAPTLYQAVQKALKEQPQYLAKLKARAEDSPQMP